MPNDKVMLITGASSGIGASVARRAVARGWQVSLLARSQARLDRLRTELGSHATAYVADVTRMEDLRAAVAATVEAHGRIDAVFANAGIGGAAGGFSGADPASWKALLMTNVYGLALTLQASAEALKASRGHVVITSSVAGRRSLPGSMYSASKWAATGIGHGFRKEIGQHGVRVTLLEPGMVDTPFFDEPKPDMLQPDDVARAVMYALDQPEHMEVHELLLLPMAQQGDNMVP